MNVITTKDVQTIANLARLGLSEAELARATEDLTNVLDHFARLQAIDTTDVPVSGTMTGLTNRTRDDVAEPNVLCSADDLLTRAQAQPDRYVKTPSVRS